MHKFYRSVLLTGMVAVGLAGCGDDVTIVEPPPPPPPPAPTVKSITVAPNGATVAIGQTIAFSAAVVADEGVATTVTWSSSDPAKATVNAATGVVTGVASGTVAIKATSTVAPTVSGIATLTVAPAPAAATISINSVTTAGGAPVVLANVAGQINVALNLERGGEQVQSVKVFLGTKEVGSQNFAAAGDEPAAAVEVINIPVNTAAFNAQTGVVEHFNGNTTLSARVITAQNQQGSASPSLNLTLANISFIAVTAEVLNGTSASSSTGILWQTGDLRATAMPVIYTAGAPAVQQIVLTPAGLSSKTLTAAPYTATWAKATTIANGGAGNGGVGSANPGVEAAGLTVGATSTVGGAVGPTGTSNAINIDNRGPGAPTFIANPNGRQNSWINASVGLVGLNNGATSNNWLVNGAADGGVGGYIRNLRVGTGGGSVANANGMAASAAPALPAPSASNTSYCGVVTASDLLGNESPLPTPSTTTCLAPPAGPFVATASQHLNFGVDIAAPTIAFSGGLANNQRINAATLGAEFQVTVSDTGAVGNSGMLSGAAVIGSITRRTASGTTCFFGGTGCAQASVNAAPGFPLVPTAGAASVAAAPAPGYYTYVARSQDAAGNQSADVTRVVVADNVAPTVSNPAVPVTITGAFTASAFINDDLSIRDYFWTAGFGGGLTAPATITLAAAPTVVDAFNAATLTNTNFAVNTQINTFLGLQATAGGVPQAYAAGAAPLNALNLFARDQTSAYVTGASPVTPTAPGAGVSITNFNLYNAATSQATICVGTAAPCGATPTAANWTAVASGTTAIFNNPFSRVDFYAANAAGTNLVLVGSVPAGSATLVDNGATRVWTYTLPVTAASLYSTLGGVQPAIVGPVNVYAFGVNAAGSVALVSGAAAQTINP